MFQEDGWEGAEYGVSIAPATIQLAIGDDTRSAEEIMSKRISGRDGKIIQNKVQALKGGTDVASCIYQNKFVKGFISVAKQDNTAIILSCDAHVERFGEFDLLFKGIARSVRTGSDANLHQDQTIEVPASKLRPTTP